MPAAQAAFYDYKSFFISAFLAHDVIDPQTLNREMNADAPLRTFVSGRLRGERGLVSPYMTHWIDVGGGYGWSNGQGILTGLGNRNLYQEVAYFWAIPAGVTWWMLRTSFVDIGLSGGLGFGFLPWHKQSGVDVAGTIDHNIESKGAIGFLCEGGLQGRLWVSKYFSIDLIGGIRYFGADMTSAVDSVSAQLFSINVSVGTTFAFGGVRGTGRAQVEVIKAGKKPPALDPSISGATTPTGTNTPSVAPPAPAPAATPAPKQPPARNLAPPKKPTSRRR